MEKRRPTADGQGSIRRINDGQCAGSVGVEFKDVTSDLKQPWLCIVARRCKNGILHEKAQLLR
jgi:hypothetical protein